MAGKWHTVFGALHTVLGWHRWWRFGLLVCCGMAIALVLTIAPVSPSVQAQTDPAAQVEQGQQEYEAGDYARAIEFLESAITAFDEQNQPLQQAITLSNLALVYQAMGQWGEAEKALGRSFALLEVPPSYIATDALPNLEPPQLRAFAAALNVYGKGLLQKSDAARALATWQQAQQAYAQVGDLEGEITTYINQLQALQNLGLFRQAEALGEQVKATIEAQANPVIKSRGLLSLGNIERAIGKLDDSKTTLETALVAAPAEDSNIPSAIELSLGSTYQALGDRETERLTSINRQGVAPWVCSLMELPDSAVPHYQAALTHYQAVTSQGADAISAQLNWLAVLQKLNQFDYLQTDWLQLQPQVLEMRPSRGQVFAEIALAQRGACLKQAITDETVAWEDIQALLTTAVATAEALDDPVAESYARGNLGGLYEYFATLETPPSTTKTLDNPGLVWRQTSQKLTEQALFLAQPSELPDIAFQWQWQLARLQKAEGNRTVAVNYYRQAVETLKAVRGNLLTVDSDVQFSFRDNVEPIYRELVDLLLIAVDPSQSESEEAQNTLKEAIQYIDTLQLSELENFLQCSLATVELTETIIDSSAANIYGIVLKDRIEVIVSRPEQPLQNHKHFIAQAELEIALDELQDNLKRKSAYKQAQNEAAEVYNWLIRPFEVTLDAQTNLADSEVKVLTFVLDTSLRNLPMGTLYDRERDRYLLERYGIAIVPSLRVVEPEPLSRQIHVFAGGLSQEVDHPNREGSFSPLENVEAEIAGIQAIFPGDFLLNDTLTSENVQQKLDQTSFPIVHLATHGEFSSDPERTFIVLADKPLFARDIDNLLRTKAGQAGIKLFVLSACRTATGDKRATLGLAGLTVRAGSRSTLATLWSVDDESAAALMQDFYQILRDNPDISRVETLRQAQLRLLENPNWQSPLYWGPYTLVGNWQ
jgi:CHAT domain-containing protein